MTIFTIDAANTALSQLLDRVEAGEEIMLARGEKPIAKLVPLQSSRKGRQFGALRGIVSVGSEFFESLPEEERAAQE